MGQGAGIGKGQGEGLGRIWDQVMGRVTEQEHRHTHTGVSYTLTRTRWHVCVYIYKYINIDINTYIHTRVLKEPPRHFLGRGPFKDTPHKPRPDPTSQLKRAILSQSNPASPRPLQPISASLSPPAASPLRGLAAAASEP